MFYNFWPEKQALACILFSTNCYEWYSAYVAITDHQYSQYELLKQNWNINLQVHALERNHFQIYKVRKLQVSLYSDILYSEWCYETK